MLAIFIYQIIGIIVIKFDLGVANKFWVKIDMCIALLVGGLIELSKIKFENSKTKLTVFFKKYNEKIVIILILIIAISNMFINDVYIMKILKDEAGPANLEDYDVIKSYCTDRHKEIEKYDGGLYRIDTKSNISLNDGILFEDYSVNHSSSTYSKSLYNFLRKLGYSVEHVIASNDVCNTRAMDMLFGIKYKMEKPKNEGVSEEIELNQYFKIYKNKYVLNLGFSVPESILEEADIGYIDALKCQNNILKKIANLDEEIYTKNKGEITEKIENLKKTEDGLYEKINQEETGKLIYEFEIEQNKEAYFYISLGYRLDKVKIFINGEQIKVPLRGMYNKMLDLGKFDIGEKVKVEIEYLIEPFVTSKNDIYVYYEDEEILEKYYNALSKEQVELKQISETNYQGKIDMQSENEYVLFTIPHDEGWIAKVDGKEVEIIKVQGELMAVKVGSGQHIIDLKFEPKGFYAGLGVSLFGIAIFVCLLFRYK